VPDKDLLLVLVLREAALRSTLVARLALSGAAVSTAQRFDERRPASGGAKPAVLVTDAGSIAEHPGGAAALLTDPQWRTVVVLGGPTARSGNDPRLLHLDPTDAPATLPKLLAQWQAES
jgi:hypothetical protein